MGIGAYSVVRYADDVADQRINLGVVVWHPVDGYRCRISSAVDRVQAIDPRITIKPLRQQLQDLKETVSTASPNERSLMDDLCQTFRHGLVISAPYPARISSAEETLDRLYELLVSPVPEIRRASSQRAFEGSLKKTVETVIRTGYPTTRLQNIGSKSIEGIPVNIGVRTRVLSGRAALWHPLSLQSESRPDAQMVNAKSTVLDILKARGIDTYKQDRQFVALQSPRAKFAATFGEVVSCLKHAADEVFITNDETALFDAVQKGLRGLEEGGRPRRARA
jgi:Protein of unknown function (DUF3037)